MGSAYSACESCFIEKPNAKDMPLLLKAVEPKQKPEKDTPKDNDASGSSTTTASNKPSDDLNIKPVPDRSKKVNISDFDRIKVIYLLLSASY